MLKIHKTRILYFGFLFAFSLIISASLTNTKVALAVDSQISGVISDSSSSPISNASIDVIDTTTNQIIVSTSSDNSGNYSVLVANGTYNIVVSPPGSTSYGPAVYNNLVLSSNKIVNFVLVPAGSVSVTGHIYSSTGQALPDQLVRLYPAGSSTPIPSTTDSNGYYSLQVSPGNFYFTIEPVSNAVSSYDIPQFYRITIDNFSVTQSQVLDITLPFKKVDVHIQNTSGDPVSGIRVDATTTTGLANSALSIGGGITNAVGDSRYGYTLPGPNTDASGNVTLWLLANSSNKSYTIKALPPSGSIYSPFNLTNVVVSGDQAEIVSLQFIHDRPVTTINLTPLANQQGYYSDPTTITFSATAASGYSIANTYYTLDGGAQQTYTGPFNVTGSGEHTIIYWSVDNAGVPEAPNTEAFTIAPPNITTTSLSVTTVGANYSETLAVEGGTSPYSWTVSLGSLPDGLTLNNSTGEITGVSTLAGSYDFTVQVVDNNGQIATQDLTIVVNPAPVINELVLSDATEEATYSQQLTATGGTSPIAWSVTSGSLPSGLAINSSTGELSGSPTLAGSYIFTIEVTDSNLISGTQEYTLIVNPPLSIVTNSLSTGTETASYSQTIATSGGTNPISWSLSSGSLPAGLSLNVSSGEIVGTPTTAGTYNFDVQASDVNGSTDTQTLSIIINPELDLSTSGNLADATVGYAYSQTMNVSGGTAPITWSLYDGSLPDGLSLNSVTGTISGTPTQPGTYNFTVQVTDANNQTAMQGQSIVVNSLPVISTTVLQNATLNGFYNQQVVVDGGSDPYSWSVISGSLPAGMSLGSSTGVISGTPTSPGYYSFSVQVIDSYGGTTTAALSITVNQAPQIVRPSLPGKKVGQNYSQSVIVTGGAPALVWSIGSGNLPTGLSLDSATGVISGTPTVAGLYDFNIVVTDANGVTDNQDYTIEINP